jgi:hypothetical protein
MDSSSSSENGADGKLPALNKTNTDQSSEQASRASGTPGTTGAVSQSALSSRSLQSNQAFGNRGATSAASSPAFASNRYESNPPTASKVSRSVSSKRSGGNEWLTTKAKKKRTHQSSRTNKNYKSKKKETTQKPPPAASAAKQVDSSDEEEDLDEMPPLKLAIYEPDYDDNCDNSDEDDDDDVDDNQKVEEITIGRSKSETYNTSLVDIRTHFLRLEEKYVQPSNGKAGIHWACVCVHCQRAFEKMREDKSRMDKGSAWMANAQPRTLPDYKKQLLLHLKKCNHFKRAVPQREQEAFFSTHIKRDASPSISTLTKNSRAISKASTVRGPIDRHLLPPISKLERENIEQLALEFVVDEAIPFNVIESKSFERLINGVRAKAHSSFPKRTKLSTTLLSNAHASAIHSQNQDIRKRVDDGHSLGMAIDGWMDVTKVHVEAIALTVGGKSYLMESEKSGHTHNGVAVARQWEVFMYALVDRLRNLCPGSTLSYLCSDDAGQ